MENFISASSISEIVNHSSKEAVLIFIHSLTCSISAEAFRRIKVGLEEKLISYPTNIIIMQTERNLSNEIEKNLNIKHESPQIILVKNGQAVYSASHYDIEANKIPQNI